MQINADLFQVSNISLANGKMLFGLMIFFFQAEDGIRDLTVTGVQTCALPICYRNEGGRLVFVRQMFQGKTAADVTFAGSAPWFASFQSGAFRADLLAAHPLGKAPVNAVTVTLSAAEIRTKPLELFKEAKSAVDLTQAPLIVAIGRGIKAPENIPQAEALAKEIGRAHV